MLFKVFFKRIALFLMLFLWVLQSFGQTRIKTMFYNLLNYSNNQVSRDKTPFLRTILDQVSPDLLLVCELENEVGSNYLFTNAIDPHNPDFEKAPFQEIQSSSSGGITQMVYYNGKKLVLETNRVIATNTRDINHYTFLINTENSVTNPIKLEVFVTHLKASRSANDRQRRLASVEDFIGALADIPSSSYVLFAGDFNFYTSNEEGYIRLISDQNPIQIVDPINRPCPNFPNDGIDYFDEDFYNNFYFWNNSSFADIHTQSTRTSNTGLIDQSGATGGLDDRFDFIMMSQNFNTSSHLFYVSNTYQTIGNNSNCYNSSVNDSSCTGTFSQNLRNALLEFSDHLPVVMEIETPENTLSTTTYTSNILLPKGNVIENNLEIKIPNSHYHFIKKIIIYDINSRKVIERLTGNKTNDLLININTSKLSSGIYYISSNIGNRPIKFLKK